MYVLVKDGAEVLGCFLLVQQTPIVTEIHTALLPAAWGARARAAAQGIVLWLWANTECERLITSVPAYNRQALKYAQRAGMTQYGVNPRSYKKRGALVDQILLGLSRPAEQEKQNTMQEGAL
jgi:RimJ/RimL family protein N-acetyltransferase